MTSVSVIISTRNAAAVLETCLKSVQEQTYQPIELIIVDRDSTDQTKAVAKRFTSTVYNYGTERSDQRNYGAKKAKGDYLLFLDADMELSPAVIEGAVDKVEKEPTVKALIIPEESVGSGYWSRVKAFERSFYIGDESIEAPRFIDRKVFLKVAGYDADLIAGEDWDLHRRLRKEGVKIGRVGVIIYHHEGHLTLKKAISKKFYYGTKIKWYLRKRQFTYSQVTPFRINFLKKPGKLLANPTLSLGLVILKSSELTAAGIGLLGSLIFNPGKGKNLES
jgi:glycosyltransferase involved in cell wall biosynthesis